MQWDHIVTLRLCCVEDRAQQCNAQAGVELARWMTPFGRGEGQWSSDVSRIAGLVAEGAMCNFTVFSAPWAGNQGKIPW